MMNKHARHDLIERYLDGSLSAAEQQEMESNLAAEPAFRSELELHRTMQQHLGDPGEMRLRAALDNLRYPSLPDDAPPAKPQNPGWLRPAAWLTLLAVAGWIAWWWSAGSGKYPPAPTTPVLENPKESAPIPPQALPPASLPPAPTQNPAKKDWRKQPIALANPADFTPNPTLDARIGGVRGGDGGANLALLRPTPNAEFRLRKGRITLLVRGRMTADSLPANQPVRLLIYSNRPEDWDKRRALFDLPFPLEPAGPGQYQVDFSQPLRLRPGLYYILAGQRRTPEAGSGYRTLWVGKFKVGGG